MAKCSRLVYLGGRWRRALYHACNSSLNLNFQNKRLLFGKKKKKATAVPEGLNPEGSTCRHEAWFWWLTEERMRTLTKQKVPYHQGRFYTYPWVQRYLDSPVITSKLRRGNITGTVTPSGYLKSMTILK